MPEQPETPEQLIKNLRNLTADADHVLAISFWSMIAAGAYVGYRLHNQQPISPIEGIALAIPSIAYAIASTTHVPKKNSLSQKLNEQVLGTELVEKVETEFNESMKTPKSRIITTAAMGLGGLCSTAAVSGLTYALLSAYHGR